MFDLEPDTTKCFSEDVEIDIKIVGNFLVQAGYKQVIDVKVTTPSGSEIYSKENADKGLFQFVSAEQGEYTVCFRNTLDDRRMNDRRGLKRRITLVLKTGADAIDFNELAKKEHIKPLEANLRKGEEMLKEIKSEFDYMRVREEQMRDINEDTNERVAWYSIFPIIAMSCLSVGQVYYLRNYFKHKKLA